MKIITLYEAPDGSRFNSQSDCVDYEEQRDRIAATMAKLKPRPNSCGFDNGNGYLQQELSVVVKAFQRLLLMAVEFGGVDEKFAKALDGHEFTPNSIVGRVLDDGNHRALNRAWSRMQCIDTKWREWGQPYFARNPDKGKQEPFLEP